MLIVLDLDDTLYLEREYVRSGFQAVDKWLIMNQLCTNFFEEAWELFEKGARGTIFNKVLAARGLCNDQLIFRLVDVYRAHIPDIQLMPDAQIFLQCQPKDSLALITDGPAISQWTKIKALHIEKYFGRIIVTDDLGKDYRKPNPKAFKQVQGTLPGGYCRYIADNPEKDFVAPAALGWRPSIRIRRYGSLHFDLPTPEGCIEAVSLEDLSRLSLLSLNEMTN